MELPLDWCRGLKGACVPSVGNPFVETARAILAEGDPPYEATPHNFQRCFRPRTVAEILDLAPTHPELKRPPQALSFPWMAPLPADAEARRAERIKRENHAHATAFGTEYGFPLFGPVSSAKGKVEVRRLVSIRARIRAEGFRLLPGASGLCTALLLAADGAYRAIVETGQLRMAALAALGHAAAPVWLPSKVVRRKEF